MKKLNEKLNQIHQIWQQGENSISEFKIALLKTLIVDELLSVIDNYDYPAWDIDLIVKEFREKIIQNQHFNNNEYRKIMLIEHVEDRRVFLDNTIISTELSDLLYKWLSKIKFINESTYKTGNWNNQLIQDNFKILKNWYYKVKSEITKANSDLWYIEPDLN